MNKLFLSTILASTVMFSGAINAAEIKTKPTSLKKDVKVEFPMHRSMNMHHEFRSKTLAKDLNLTPEQEAQAQKINQEGQEKLKPLMDEMRTIREKMDAERTENMKKFEGILTNDQKAKFEEMKKKENQEREQKREQKREEMHKRFSKEMHKAPKAK